MANSKFFRRRFVLHPGTNDLCQRFDGKISPVTVEKIFDADFELHQKTLVEPYRLTNVPLYRIYFFETPMGKFWYGDLHHAIMNGTHDVERNFRALMKISLTLICRLKVTQPWTSQLRAFSISGGIHYGQSRLQQSLYRLFVFPRQVRQSH